MPRVDFWDGVRPTDDEAAAPMPGDDRLLDADVVMNRAFTVDAPPPAVWPWLVQLGKRRAGWYLPERVERLVPRPHRAIRQIDPRWQQLRVGDVIPDYGGRHETFTVAELNPGSSLVYTSVRGRTNVIWAISLHGSPGDRTRVRLRLRLDPVKHVSLANTLGELVDVLTIAGMAAGLRERVAEQRARSGA